MVISLRHAFTSPRSNGVDPTQVQPSNWNAEHTLTMATARILGRTTAGTGPAEEISIGAGLTLSGGVLASTATALATSLSALVPLTPAADRLPYYTGASTAALAVFSAFGRSLVDDADATAARSTLGLGTLSTLSSITTAQIAAATLVTEAEGISANDNDTTIPTSASVKDYVDTAVASAGFNPATQVLAAGSTFIARVNDASNSLTVTTSGTQTVTVLTPVLQIAGAGTIRVLADFSRGGTSGGWEVRVNGVAVASGGGTSAAISQDITVANGDNVQFFGTCTFVFGGGGGTLSLSFTNCRIGLTAARLFRY